MACSRLARRPRVRDRDNLWCARYVREEQRVGRKLEEDRRPRHTRIVARALCCSLRDSVESRQRRRDVKEEKKKKKTGSRSGNPGKTRRAMLEGFVR